MIPKVLVRRIQHTANLARAQGVSNSTVHVIASGPNGSLPIVCKLTPESLQSNRGAHLLLVPLVSSPSPCPSSGQHLQVASEQQE